MSDISDQELMQFADDHGLDPARRRVIEIAILSDPEVTGRVAAYQATGRKLGERLDGLLDLPLPDRLIDAIMAAPAATPRQPRPTQRSPDPRPSVAERLAGILSELFTLRAATALAGAMLAGIGFGWALSALVEGPPSGAGLIAVTDGRPMAHGELAAALDTVSSGTTITEGFWRRRIAIKPVLSFATLNQSVCRQYEIEFAGRERFIGLGCRESTGRWRIEAQVAAPVAAKSGSDVVPAAGAREPSAVDQAVDHLMAGNALTIAKERDTMQNGWKLK